MVSGSVEMRRGGYAAFAAVLILLVAGSVASQESLSRYYYYPFSVGVGYQPLSPIGDIVRRATVNDVSGKLRVPLPFVASLHPFVIGGMVSFDSDEQDEPTILGGALNDDAALPDYDQRDTWDHSNYFGGLGLGYAHRISKEFEAGGELYGAVSQSYYPQRVVTADGTWYPIGELGLILGVDGKISLNPTFNLSIDVIPSFRYDMTLGNLPDFDGLYFGLGFAAHYRFGQDPDAPQAEVNALDFVVEELPPVFAAMQKVYVDRPISHVTIANIEDNDVTNLEVAFNQATYMDTPTQCAEFEQLEAGESVQVPLHASFNDEVFNTVDVKPLNGEIIATYTYRNRTVTQTRSVTFNLQDRNALTWDETRKVAAFITPRDSAVRNYASFVSEQSQEDNTAYLPDGLEFAMQAYEALAALDLGYQPDPRSPFEEVQGDTVVIDSVSLPRETLRRGTGDCDDITVLYNAMVESIGKQSGIVTIPGHIYAAVDTGLAPRNYTRIHPDREMTLAVDDTLWVLVEITLIGEASFIDAWETGMQEYHATDPAVREFYSTSECQVEYAPVGLRDEDIGLQYGNPEEFRQPFRRDRDRLATLILSPIREETEARNRPRSWNHLGVIAAQLKQHHVAEDAFSRAANLDHDYMSPRVNLGALRFLQEDYQGALSAFENAKRTLSHLERPDDNLALAVNLNLARTLHALGRYDEAAALHAAAEEINPEEAAKYQYIASGDASGGRAGAAGDVPMIRFVDEGEE